MQLARRLTRVSHQHLAAAATVQGYQMRDEAVNEDIRIIKPEHDGGIRTAVFAWYADPAAAKARYGPIASWDTSGITNMRCLFYYKEDFNEDISRWNVSNVVAMDMMFSRAASFNGDLSCWEVGQVQNMRFMFSGATSFNGDLSRWNVSNVVYMDLMFERAASFTGDPSRWEVGQVESMHGMFRGATSYNGDLSSWDVGQVESMTEMFHGATSFTRQLGGAWSTSTANKYAMFRNSPGTIAGKVKDADGTISIARVAQAAHTGVRGAHVRGCWRTSCTWTRPARRPSSRGRR